MTPRVGLAAWHLSTADLVNYRDRLFEAGMEVVDLTQPGEDVSRLSGLVVPGGRDVDPALYNEKPNPETDEPHRDRDDYEISLLRQALVADMPILAICRGLQILNVCLGGSLLQHIEGANHVWQPDGQSLWHDVTLTPVSRLRDAYGTDVLLVNSRHHQAVTPDRLAPNLRRTAMSSDGFVEGFESSINRWVVAVQWHPERLEQDVPGFAESSRRLFAAFKDALRT